MPQNFWHCCFRNLHITEIEYVLETRIIEIDDGADDTPFHAQIYATDLNYLTTEEIEIGVEIFCFPPRFSVSPYFSF